jgi:hypothetical protein
MTEFQVTLAIVLPFILIAGILMMKYLKGDFSFEEKVIDSGYIVNDENKRKGTYRIIERKYDNGKIVLREERL